MSTLANLSRIQVAAMEAGAQAQRAVHLPIFEDAKVLLNVLETRARPEYSLAEREAMFRLKEGVRQYGVNDDKGSQDENYEAQG